MDLQQIQTRLDTLAKAMSKKGLAQSHAEFELRSGTGPVTFVRWRAADHSFPDHYEWAHAGTPSEQLDQLDAWCAALPEPEEFHRREFLSLAGKAADYAAEHLPGDEIADAVRASIVAGMQRLSENMLTDQSGAA